MRRLVLVSALAALVTVPLAFATTTASDPNDVSGLLDLHTGKAVRDGKLLRFTISMYDAWSSKVLQGRIGTSGPAPGSNRLTVLYDANRDGRADFWGRMVYLQGHLTLTISGRTSHFEGLPVKRPNAKTASFIHPVDVFWRKLTGTKTLGLAVTSRYEGARDRLPNSGWMKVVFHLS